MTLMLGEDQVGEMEKIVRFNYFYWYISLLISVDMKN